MKKLERVGDYGFDISRSMEAINQLIDEVEALKENQVTAIMETSDTMKIFWKDKHIVLKNPEPADDKPVQTRRVLGTDGIIREVPEGVVRELPDTSTHRTVTLRIPKGMRIGEAIEKAWYNDDAGTDCDNWLEDIYDNMLQKALDEVEHE